MRCKITYVKPERRPALKHGMIVPSLPNAAHIYRDGAITHPLIKHLGILLLSLFTALLIFPFLPTIAGFVLAGSIFSTKSIPGFLDKIIRD